MADTKKPDLHLVVQLPDQRELAPEHRAHLHTSGLTDERIDAAGFYTEHVHRRIAELLHLRRWSNGRVLVLPFFLPGSDEVVMCRVRPDHPRKDKKKSKPAKPSFRKYEQPWDVPTIPYFPLGGRTDDRLRDASKPLILVEGEKKAELLDELGYAVVGAVGVYNFHDKPHKEAHDEWRLHPLILEHVALKGRQVVICFDSDVLGKDQVLVAEGRLAGMVHAAGGVPVGARIPDTEEKYGIDDFFVKFGRGALEAVIDSPVPVDPLPVTETHAQVKHFRGLRDSGVPGKLRFPAGYEIDSQGRLARATEESFEVIERAPILIARQLHGLYSGETQVELAFEAGGAWRKAMVGRKAISDSRTAIAELAPIGAPIDSNTASKVITWLRDFEHVNAERMPRDACVDRFGWHGSGRFMLGDELVCEEGAEKVVFDSRAGRESLAKPFSRRGSYEAHLETLRKAWEADPIAALAICASLAAPLLRPLSASGFAVHLAGDSSRGKSSMLKIGASLYGDPRNEVWVATWNSTAAGHEVRAGVMADLPLPVDEAGVSDARTRERAVYALMNGGGRLTSRRDGGGLRDMRSWHSIVISTGESLLAASDTATGAQTRVLQYRVPGFGRLGASGVDALRQGAEDNHGQVGREWISSLVSIDDWEPYRASLKQRARAMQERAPNGPRARQGAFYALLAHAEAMASDVLGLGRPEGETMARLYVEEAGDDGREEVRPASERALDLVAEWVSSRPTAFLRLRLTSSGRREPVGESRASQVLGYVDDDALLLLPNALRAFLADHGIDDKVVAADWKAGGLTEVNEAGRLTSRRRIAGRNQRFVAILRRSIDWEPPDNEFEDE